MTHLSDFSFLQRAVSLVYVFFWYMYRVWTLDRFGSLHPRNFRKGELKSIVSVLILVMIPFQLFYDVTSCKIKYDEGYADVFGHIIVKPETVWTKAHQSLVIPTEYSLCVGFSLQTGTLLLLQCFWNYLATTVAKVRFMSSNEFKLYIVWTVTALFLFPILQYNFSRDVYDVAYKESMPQLVFACGIFIVAILGVRSHLRFQRLLNVSRDVDNSNFVTSRIRHYQELNLILTVALFLASTSMIILCADGLTGRKTLNTHKFSADFLICNTSFCCLVAWVMLILIFHPKKERNHQPIDNSHAQSSSYNMPSRRNVVKPVSTVAEYDKACRAYPLALKSNFSDSDSQESRPQ